MSAIYRFVTQMVKCVRHPLSQNPNIAIQIGGALEASIFSLILPKHQEFSHKLNYMCPFLTSLPSNRVLLDVFELTRPLKLLQDKICC